MSPSTTLILSLLLPLVACSLPLASPHHLPGQRDLVAACRAGDMSAVEVLLQGMADPDSAVEKNGNSTPLLAAIDAGQVEVARALILKHKADPNVGKPIELALKKGHPEIFGLLLDSGVKISLLTSILILTKQSPMRTPQFVKAANAFVPKLVERLSKQSELNEALLEVSRWGLVEMADLLLKKGADVNFYSSNMTSYHCPLFAAALKGHVELVKFFIAKGGSGAPMKGFDSNLGYPLIHTLDWGNWAVASALLSAGASVTGPQALSALREFGMARLLERLRKIGMVQGDQGFEEAIEALRAAKFPGDSFDLRNACLDGNVADVSSLLAGGVFPNQDCLMAGVQSGNLAIVSALLSGGAEPVYDAVHDRVLSKDVAMVRLLLRYGANPSPALLLDERRMTPFQTPHLAVAVAQNDVDMVKALVEASADVNVLLSRDEPLLAKAVKKGHEQIADMLRRHGAH